MSPWWSYQQNINHRDAEVTEEAQRKRFVIFPTDSFRLHGPRHARSRLVGPADQDGAVVGFSVASAKDASIWALFVRQEHEGKGVGRKLLNLATQWLFDAGAPKITLSTATGTRADKLYQRSGWLRGEVGSNGEVVFSLDRPIQGLRSTK